MCDDAGAWLVPTQRALYHRGDSTWRRVGWEQVLRFVWDDERHSLAVTTWTPHGPRRMTIRLEDRGRLVDIGRERVAATFLFSTQVSLGDHGSALVTARRQPGTDQTVWQVTLDDHLEPVDPLIGVRITAAIGELRGQVEV